MGGGGRRTCFLAVLGVLGLSTEMNDTSGFFSRGFSLLASSTTGAGLLITPSTTSSPAALSVAAVAAAGAVTSMAAPAAAEGRGE